MADAGGKGKYGLSVAAAAAKGRLSFRILAGDGRRSPTTEILCDNRTGKGVSGGYTPGMEKPAGSNRRLAKNIRWIKQDKARKSKAKESKKRKKKMEQSAEKNTERSGAWKNHRKKWDNFVTGQGEKRTY